MNRRNLTVAFALTVTATMTGLAIPAHAFEEARTSSTVKGSFLIYSKIDLRWDASGELIQDTILELTNDLSEDVYVQMYFINGDEPRDAIFAGDPPQMIAEGEPGWNFTDLQVLITANQPVYWSAATGLPLGAAPFDILDPDSGSGPGRPSPNGGRMLRGFIYLWAVNAQGENIRWNHLSGAATIINYADQTAWEYNASAFQAGDGTATGDVVDDDAGDIHFNGTDYDYAYDVLLMDFFASGSQAFSSDTVTVSIDTELTLHMVHQNFDPGKRPRTTSAKFDIWNENERRFSGTQRCFTCWDQALLSDYDAPNHFLIQNLQTDKGKARIDGVENPACDDEECGRRPPFDGPPPNCSTDQALAGVIAKEIAFSGASNRRTRSGRSLVGMGTQEEPIHYVIIAPPGELRGEAYDRAGLLAPITGEDTRTFEGSKRIDRSSRSR